MISTASTLTDDRLKAILPVDGEASLTRQLDRVDDVYTHLDHALHDHVVLLKLWPSQLCTLSPTRTPVVSFAASVMHSKCTGLMQSAADGTGRDDSP